MPTPQIFPRTSLAEATALLKHAARHHATIVGVNAEGSSVTNEVIAMADGDEVDVPALTEAMRRRSDADRRAAFDASPNVIGFGRFVFHPPRS